MIFTEFRFLVFFAIVLGVHWALPRNRPRKVWLLLASYTFYAAWDWRFLSLILGSTVVDYFVGLKLDDEARDTGSRRAWIAVSVIVNLSLLAVFKYFHFFADSAAALLQSLGLTIEPSSLRIILPVGISFYTFQTMSYSLDIYRGKLRATRDFLDLALFVGFFPQLVAGPIVRARDFLPQLVRRRVSSDIAFRPLLLLFLSGFFKKACISDNISGVVDAYFVDPSAFDAASAWIAVMLYAVQIYCDFSGYSDMAIATAGFLGYSLSENFAFPYFAGSIQDFWRRWHISLSSWLRDYLYIPLGGGYGGRVFRYRNLMLTMLLGGLWHGAAWRFVIWGGLHGLALIVHREFHERVRGTAFRVPAPVGAALTFWWVGLTWIFFRATDWQSAFVTARAYLLFESPGTSRLPEASFVLFAVLAAMHWVACRGTWKNRLIHAPRPLFSAWIGVVAALILIFKAAEVSPFIYFQF